MRVLLYGSRGWIGGMILSKWSSLYPEDTVYCSNTRLNFNNINEIKKDLINTDRVFISIGRTYGYDDNGVLINNIDYLEKHLDENLNDNLSMPLLMAMLCKERNIHLSYIGTGCIFSRNTRNNDYEYKETDVPDFFGSSYSVVKGVTDNFMKQFDNVLNFRIRMPIINSHHSRNFITKLLNYDKICNYPNSMTYLPDIIPIMIKMCRNSSKGTYNTVNKGVISHKEILDMYNEMYTDHVHDYKLIEEDKLNTLLKSKRSNNVLVSDKLDKLNECQLRDIKVCVREAIKEMGYLIKNLPADDVLPSVVVIFEEKCKEGYIYDNYR